MRICLGNIHRKIGSVLHAVVAVCGKTHERCSAALHLDHIAYSLFVEILLCEHADNKNAVLDKTDRSVLELSCCVCLGVDVADLLHLEASFKADSVVYTASDEECILSSCKLICEPLDTFLVLEYLFDLVGESIQFIDECSKSFLIYLLLRLAELHCKHVAGNKLCAVCLCCSNGDLGTCKRIEHIVRLASNGRSDYIYDAESLYTFVLSFTERCKAVGSLTRLTDDDNKTVLDE